jgi:hypothetical protein
MVVLSGAVVWFEVEFIVFFFWGFVEIFVGNVGLGRINCGVGGISLDGIPGGRVGLLTAQLIFI